MFDDVVNISHQPLTGGPLCSAEDCLCPRVGCCKLKPVETHVESMVTALEANICCTHAPQPSNVDYMFNWRHYTWDQLCKASLILPTGDTLNQLLPASNNLTGVNLAGGNETGECVPHPFLASTVPPSAVGRLMITRTRPTLNTAPHHPPPFARLYVTR